MLDIVGAKRTYKEISEALKSGDRHSNPTMGGIRPTLGLEDIPEVYRDDLEKMMERYGYKDTVKEAA